MTSTDAPTPAATPTRNQVLVAIPRLIGLLYAFGALAFSLGLLLQARRRGLGELALWLPPYACVFVLSLVRPRAGPLVAGLLAFVLGFARTYRHGQNLDLGLSLIALAIGVEMLGRLRRPGAPRTDLAGLALLGVSIWSVLSLGFVFLRVRGFAPAPGFAYHVYRFNAFGMPSEDVLVLALAGAAGAFLWFGLYEYARTFEVSRRLMAWGVFSALLVNSAVLLVQRHLAPEFLHPAGFPIVGRLNGATSFCYALGDATAALFLLLPVWGGTRGVAALRTVVGVLLLAHAAVASGSRTALAAMLAAALLWLLSRVTRLTAEGARAPAVLALAAALLVALASSAAYWMTPADQTTPIGRLKEGVEREGVIGHLVATRLGSYPLAFRVFRAYPLVGYGVGISPAEIEKQRALLGAEKASDPYLIASYLPNQFLDTGAALGVPVLLALAGVFLLAAIRAFSRAAPQRSRDLGVGVLVLAAVLQLGPTFYNSEALVLCWLILGLAAGGALSGERSGERAPAGLAPQVGTRASAGILAGALVLGLGGQLFSRPALAVDRQWQQLRWRLNIGMLPPQPDGQWTGSEATFSTDTAARALRLRWHAGDRAARSYSAQVAFYVDGVLAERTLAMPGRVRESVLPLPAAEGFKRISVEVSPPFVPAAALGGPDRRELGIFLHSVVPEASVD